MAVVWLVLPAALRTWATLSLMGLTALGMAVNATKFYLTGMPITFLDLRIVAAEPEQLWHAMEPQRSAVTAVLLVATAYMVWSCLAWSRWFRENISTARRGASHSGRWTVACWMLIGTTWLQVAVRLPETARTHAAVYFREEMAEDLYAYSQSLTIWGFLLYSHGRESRRSGNLYVVSAASPVPDGVVTRTAERFLNPEWRVPALLPHVVIVQAESTFDPSSIFRLSRKVPNPLFDPHPLARADGPLLVNAVGGGSWISEFEAVSGFDSRIFGYAGFYTHVSVSPYIRGTLLTYLSARGYHSSVYYSADASFFGVGAAFARYGADAFVANPTGQTWEPNDEILVEYAMSGIAKTGGPQLVFVATAGNHSPHRCEGFAEASQFVTTFDNVPQFTNENCVLNEYMAKLASTGRAIETALKTLAQEEARTGRPFVLLVYGDHLPHTFATNERLFEHREHREFEQFRYREAQRETFFRIFSSLDNRFTGLPKTAPHVSVLPTLMSAYVARSPADLYLA